MKKVFHVLLAAAAVIYLIPSMVALSQAETATLAVEAFKAGERPAAIFDHDVHNEKAGLDDCAVCHHGATDDGKRDPGGSSEGVPCADCHKVKADKGRTDLMTAYHTQCKGCHEEKGKGPLACGECHVRQ